MDIANLQIKVGADSVPKAYSELSKLEIQSVKTENAARRLSASQTASEAAYRRSIASIQRVTLEEERLRQSQEKMRQQVDKTTGSFNGMMGALRLLGGAYLGLKALNLTDQFTLLKGRIDLSTKSVEESAEAWDGLIKIARETGALEASVAIFQRLSLVREEIKATNDEMLQFTETVNKLGVSSGASGDALKFGLTQLGQSLSSDIVRAEEFNSIMENIPAVGKAIADQLGITTGQLRMLVIDGQVLSKDVFAAILNASEAANEQFAKMPMTVGRAWSTLITDMGISLDILNKNTEATGFFIKAIGILGEAFKGFIALVLSATTGLETIFTMIAAGFLDGINLAIDALNKFGNAVADNYNAFSGYVKEKTGGRLDLGERQGRQIERIGPAGASYTQEANESIMRIGGDYVNSINQLFPGEKQADGTVSATREISQNYANMAKNLGNANKESEKAQKLVDKTVESLVFRNQQLVRSNEEQELFNQLRQANVDIDSEAGQRISDLVSEYQRLKKEVDQVERVTNDLADSFGEAFEGFITGTKDARSALKGLIDDLQKMLIQEMVTGPLKSIITGAGSGGGGGILGSLISGLGGFFGGGSSFSGSGFAGFSPGGDLGNILGSLTSAATMGFADGGSFKVGGSGGTDSQLVTFRASPDETVTVTRPDQQKSTGSAGNTYNIDARGASVEAVARLEQMLMNLDQSVERRAVNATNAQFKRDPTFGRRN